MGKITSPELLRTDHDTSAFEGGNPTLDEWLQKRALKNQENGASRTFVICEGINVIGYYALATGSVERDVATGNSSRGMPEPIPVIVLCRLAVNKSYQGKRLGASLLKDVMLRTVTIASNVGIRGLLVHAISEDAKRFYLKYGFQVSPIESMTLLLSINNIKKHLSE